MAFFNPSSTGYPVDTLAPTVTRMAINVRGAQGGMVNAGDVIEITVNMSEVSYLSGASPWVNLNIGGAIVQARYAGGTGSNALIFTYTVTTGQSGAISLGANSLVVGGSLADAAGNRAVTNYGSLTNTGYMVDTTAPTAPVINVVAGNNIVNAAEAGSAISGMAEAGSTIRLTLGANVRTVGTNASGAWTYALSAADITAMGQGAKTISATATDAAGNVSAATTRAITIDTVAPIAPTINAVARDNIVNAAEVGSAIGGMAEAGSTIRLTLGANVRTLGTNASGAWTYALSTADIAAMGQGVKTISVTATDAAGNATTTTRAITIDTVAPTVTITDDVAGTANLAKGQVTYTFAFSKAVNDFTANDVVVTGGSKGMFTAISNKLYTLVVNPNIHASSVTVGVAAGVATDTAGNSNTAAIRSVQAVDLDAPTLGITDNVSGTASGPVTYTFAFTEAVSGFSAADVVVTGGLKGAFTARSASLYTLVVNPTASLMSVGVAAGVAQDLAGNSNLSAAASQQEVAVTALSTVLSSIRTNTGATATVQNDGSTRDNTLEFYGTAVAGSEISIYDNGALLRKLTMSGNYPVANPGWSITPAAFRDGVHHFQVQMSTGTDMVSVDYSVTIDTVAPTGSFSNTLRANTGTIPDITWGATTTDHTLGLSGTMEAGSTVRIYDMGSYLGNAAPMSETTWSFTPTLLNGSHSFSATITDQAGNLTSLQGGNVFVRGTNWAPSGWPHNYTLVDVIEFTSMETNSGKTGSIMNGGTTRDNTLELSGSVSYADPNFESHHHGIIVSYSTPGLPGYTYLGETWLVDSNYGNQSWHFTAPPLPEGHHTLIAQLVDEDPIRYTTRVTATTADPLEVTIDTTPPSIEFKYFITDTGLLPETYARGHTTDRTPVLRGMVESGSTVKVFIDDAADNLDGYMGFATVGTPLASGFSAWTYTTPTLPNGHYTFYYEATDMAGNTSNNLPGPEIDIYDAAVTRWNPVPAGVSTPVGNQGSGWGAINVLEALNAVTTGPMVSNTNLYRPVSNDVGIVSSNMDKVWQAGYTGRGVTIAVIDTGLDLTNNDLTRNLSPWNWDFGNNDGDVTDVNGHGTGIASIIIAANNGVGLTGAAYDATLMVLKTSTDGSVHAGNASINSQAIMYAVDKGANIINLSWGSQSLSTIGLYTYQTAISYANAHNVLIVASAGNEGGVSPSDPAGFAMTNANVLAVGGYGLRNGAASVNMVSFSNRAGAIAASYNFVDANAVNVPVYNLDDTIVLASGTSAAVPYVSGAAALLWQANPGLTAVELAHVIAQTSVPIL